MTACALCEAFTCAASVALIIGVVALLRWIIEMIPLGGNESRPVFVTGCDHGFGYHLALRLLRDGFPVFAGCYSEKSIEKLQHEAKHLPGKLDAFQLDVTSDESVEKAAKHIEETTGGLWSLVNNAGIMGQNSPDDWLSVNEYKNCMEVNLYGVIRCTQACKNLLKRRQGRVVCVSSIAARVALATAGPYTTSKFAVQGYINTIRLELAPFGVTVHTLEPGFFNTALLNAEQTTNDFRKFFERADEETKAYYGKEHLESMIENRNETMMGLASASVDPVINAYYSAISSRFPRFRYRPGFDSKFIYYPASMLPDMMQMLGTAWLSRHTKPAAKAVVKNPFAKN